MAGDKNKPEDFLTNPGQAGTFMWDPGDIKIMGRGGEKRTPDGRPKERRDDE